MIEPKPFNKCKGCIHEHCGQMNMPCRACVFGSKFERAFEIPKLNIEWRDTFTIDETSNLHPKNIIKNIDESSIYPDVISSTVYEYCKNDVETTKKMYEIMNRRIEEMKGRKYIPEIKNVEFNPPLTVVIWEDGTKTFVKAHGGEQFDPEKGLAMAICKKLHGNKYSYINVFDRWIDKYEKKVRKERFANSDNIKKAAEQATAAINRVTKAIADAVNKEKE